MSNEENRVVSDLMAGRGSVAQGRALMTKKMVAMKLCVCPRTLERLVVAGVFPQPLRVASDARWHPDDVDAFVAKALAATSKGGSGNG